MKALAAAILLAIGSTAVLAQSEMTVSQLLADGWEVEAMIPSSAGPGILLEKDDRLILCFVAETPQSPTITTQYCKAVE